MVNESAMQPHARRLASLAALVQGATYLAGLVLMVTWLIPQGFLVPGQNQVAWAALVVSQNGWLVLFYTVVYLVNGMFLVVLSVCLPAVSGRGIGLSFQLLRAFGLVWAALVLSAGMIAVTALHTMVPLCSTNPGSCVAQWQFYATLVNALGGGIEMVGGAWFALAAAGLRTIRYGPVGLSVLALFPALAGLASLWPAAAEAAGAVFGLSAMIWFLWCALVLRPQR